MTAQEPMAPLPKTSPAPSALLLGLACALALACAHGTGGGDKAPRTLLPDAQAPSHGAPTPSQRLVSEGADGRDPMPAPAPSTRLRPGGGGGQKARTT